MTKMILLGLINLALVPLALFLFIAKYLFNIQFIRIRDSRIGHLAANTDIFLRRLQLGIIKNNLNYVGVASKNVANKHLFKMFRRKIPIIQIPQPSFLKFLLKIISTKSILKKTGLFYLTPDNNSQYFEFLHAKPNLMFTPFEAEKGKELLNKINVGDNWFVCFHARDSAYLDRLYKKEDNYHKFRNGNILNYLKAVHYVTKQGGYAVRMGANVKQSLSHVNNPKIIDYATNYRSEFGDVYLSARCKFFIGDGCGINQVAQIFHTPLVWVNVIPLENPPWSSRDIFIPKKIWSHKKKRILTFNEIIDLGLSNAWTTEEYDQADVEVLENTSKEIFDVVREMNQRLDGTWISTAEDEKLQLKYKSLFPKGFHCHGFPSRVGAKFLRENKNLLE